MFRSQVWVSHDFLGARSRCGFYKWPNPPPEDGEEKHWSDSWHGFIYEFIYLKEKESNQHVNLTAHFGDLGSFLLQPM